MEKHLDDISRCYICDEIINNTVKDILSDTSDYSQSVIYVLLEKITGHDILKASDDDERKYLGCLNCFNKVNEYDLASMTVEKVRKELIYLLEHTTEKYYQNIEVISSTAKDDDFELEHEQIILNDDNDDDDEDEVTYIVKSEEEITDEKYDEPLEEGTDEYEIHFFDVAINNEKNCDTNEELHEPPEFVNYEEAIKTENSNSNSRDILIESPTNFPEESKSPVDEKKTIKHRKPCCKMCRIDFSSFKELREHRKENHDDGDRLVCDICGVRYKTRSALNIHIDLHNGISPFNCEICGKKFTQKGALKRHKPIHTGERPYQCEKCGKQFTHYSSFHMHNLAHDDIRDKKCEICGLLLRSSSHLNRHMLVHTGQKPHACPKCGQRFAQRYNMMSHLRSHQGIHRKKKYTCEICNKGFSKEEQFNKHTEEKGCRTQEIIGVYQIIDGEQYREDEIIVDRKEPVS